MKRLRLQIQGIVQGVGFRPFVFRLAHALQLSGWVRNDAEGVTLEIQGSEALLQAFETRLRPEAPPQARIDHIKAFSISVLAENTAFTIATSQHGQANPKAQIGPDISTCPACLAEIFDPDNRRYRYAFSNCTDCGPRYTIAQRLPYDRAQTSMAGFVQCPDCLAEYTDPANRRFHAEPNACPVCGPQLRLLDGDGQIIAGDPLEECCRRLIQGDIVAIKGLGGFHLACDARNPAAVARLRDRKAREEKPLAIMVANTASLAELTELTPAEKATLESAARPIVLLRKLAACDQQLSGVAPGLAWLGVMLPYTPLHYLLFHAATGHATGMDWLEQAQSFALVMTSANPHGEPLVTDNESARHELQGIADVILQHDRDIVIRNDDSVVRHLSSLPEPQFIRRARGFSPLAIPLANHRTETLALGGLYKNTACFTRGDQAFLSQYIGDLDRVANCQALESTIAHMQQLLQVQPQCIAHDLHPDFFSTLLAQRLAQDWQIPCIAVQHHHAHIAAVLAEHHHEEAVLGLALDGVGYGCDGTAWGGELLLVEGAHFTRLGHLRPISLPGGDRAAREPWRMGAAALALLGRQDEISQRYAKETGASLLGQLLQRSLVQTTSMGRYFDAAAGLLNIRSRMSFEGQAAILLEGLAETYGEYPLAAPLHQIIQNPQGLMLDLNPLLEQIATSQDAAQGAALFHAGVIQALAAWVAIAAESSGIKTVACSGGCFLNAILCLGLRQALQAHGIRMLEAQAVPPGDGGLALGQAWVAQRS